jgi:hypothetical protein
LAEIRSDFGGSISAEHGVGSLVAELEHLEIARGTGHDAVGKRWTR